MRQALGLMVLTAALFLAGAGFSDAAPQQGYNTSQRGNQNNSPAENRADQIASQAGVCSGPGALLPAPQGFTVTVVPSRNEIGQVNLRWQAVAGATGYKVYRTWPSVYYDHTHARDQGADHNLIANVTDGNAWALTLANNVTTATIQDLPLFLTVQFQVVAIKNVTAKVGAGNQSFPCEGTKSVAAATPVAAPDAPVWGFADTHTHQFANMAAGGYMIGKPYGPPDDALNGDYAGHGLFVGQLPHKTGGYPNFDGWPSAQTQIHQQMYEDWLFRAFVGGLKLMVMHGLNTESLCIGLSNAQPREQALYAQGLVAASALPAGAAAGVGVGAGIGSAIGTFLLPGIGTVLGSIAGGTAGGVAGGAVATAATGSFYVTVDALNGALNANIQQNQGAVARCDDMTVAMSQIQAAKDMETYLNNQCAAGANPPRCPQRGMGWYHIVQSAEEARATINRGQLAVVLGIEVDRLFGCTHIPLGDPRAGGHPCDPTQIQQSLNAVVASGVRHIFPAHLADTAFAGMALYSAPITWNVNSHFLNGTWIDVAQCPAELYNLYPTPPNIAFNFNDSELPPAVTNLLFDIEGLGLPATPPVYPYPISGLAPQGHCNRLGLTPEGMLLVQGMMDRHLIIDIDHMSLNSVNGTMHLTWETRKTSPYPVVMGHNGPVNIFRDPKKKTERNATDNELSYLSLSGGVIGVGIGGGTASTDIIQYHTQFNSQDWGGPLSVLNDCSDSTKTWAQQYLYTVDHLQGPLHAPVAFASDQFLVPFLGARFGQKGCGGDATAQAKQFMTQRVPYPFSVRNPGVPIQLAASHLGNKTWDYNVDGMAHIGMYPDLLQDALNVGMTPQSLQPIYHSAEAYIDMWQKIEGTTVSQAPAAPSTTAITAAPPRATATLPAATGVRTLAGVNTGNLAVATQAPLSVSVCRTLDGRTCLPVNSPQQPPTGNVNAIITVTASGAAVTGATVTVTGENISGLTNQNGIAVINYRPCVTAGANPTAGPCAGTVSKVGYQTAAIRLP